MNLRRNYELSEILWVLVIVFAAALAVLAIIPVRVVEARVSGRSWHTWVELVEHYETVEVVCYTSRTTVNGKRQTTQTCGPETKHHTRVLDRRDLYGEWDDEVVSPPAFSTGYKQDNRFGSSFEVAYVDGDGVRHANGVSESAYSDYVLGTNCKLWKNVYGFVIVDKCEPVYGR